MSRSEPHHFTPDLGKLVGKHRGAHYFTIGQRKGLNVGGKIEPLFVIGTDVKENVIYTGMGENHPGLFRSALRIANVELHWIRTDLAMKPGEERRYMARIRYRQPLEGVTLSYDGDQMFLVFDNPQRGVAPGQFAAWYDGDELIGSGVIS
jgi:tRNA-specific 2-thiouridylase